MNRFLFVTFVASLLSITSPCLAQTANIQTLIDKATSSALNLAPSAKDDIAKLFVALQKSHNEDDMEPLIDAICAIGDKQGHSPTDIKNYIGAQAPATLLEVVRGHASGNVRMDAALCFRTIDVSDDVLDQAIAASAADKGRDPMFLASTAGLLSEWKRNRPKDHAIQPSDKNKEKAALDYLRDQSIEVDESALTEAFDDGDVKAVAALLDAGVRIDAGNDKRAHEIFMGGLEGTCSDESKVPTERILEIIDLFIAHSLKLDSQDSFGNTYMLHVVQFCNGLVARRLADAGAPVNTPSKNTTPLLLAFMTKKWDVAKVLVDHGAKVKKNMLDRLFPAPLEDADQQALVQRAAEE